MRFFVGTHINKVDRKGRVSVPAAFRAALSDQAFNGIVTYPHLEQVCLEGGGLDRISAISDALDNNFGLFSAEEESFASAILANTHQLQFDEGGRVLVPRDLLDHVGIEDQAAFVGLGKRFQIWNPVTWADAQAQHKEVARQNRGGLVKSGASKPGGNGP